MNTYYNQLRIRSVLPWQIDLLQSEGDEVLRGRNLVYCAPTGIGKSLVYELLRLSILDVLSEYSDEGENQSLVEALRSTPLS